MLFVLHSLLVSYVLVLAFAFVLLLGLVAFWFLDFELCFGIMVKLIVLYSWLDLVIVFVFGCLFGCNCFVRLGLALICLFDTIGSVCARFYFECLFWFLFECWILFSCCWLLVCLFEYVFGLNRCSGFAMYLLEIGWVWLIVLLIGCGVCVLCLLLV